MSNDDNLLPKGRPLIMRFRQLMDLYGDYTLENYADGSV